MTSETERQVAGQAWATAHTRRIARQLCENRPPRGQDEQFEQATFVAHCQQLAARENVSLASVVLDYASDRRF